MVNPVELYIIIPSRVSKIKQPTDWELCVLRQKIICNVALTDPLKGKKVAVETGYNSLATNLKDLERLKALLFDFD